MKKNKRLLEHTKVSFGGIKKKIAVIARRQDMQWNDVTLTVIFCDLGGTVAKSSEQQAQKVFKQCADDMRLRLDSNYNP